MKRITPALAALVAASACASGPPPLTEQERAVRSVTDASECEYVTAAEARKIGPKMTLQDSIKRHTVRNGGDSFKILHTRDGYSELFGRTTTAEIEIYRCRN